VVFADEARYSFRLKDIKLPDLIQYVYSDIFKKNYVFDHSFLNAAEVVTVDLNQVTEKQFNDFVRLLLDTSGYKIVDVAGGYYFSKKTADDDVREVFVYKPVYRSVSYLIDMLNPVFDKSAFTSFRGVARSDSGFQSGSDNGSSAFSMVNKDSADLLVFNGSYLDVIKLKNLLPSLDVVAGELFIKAVVFEVRNDFTDSNAVSFVAELLRNSAKSLNFSVDFGVSDDKNSLRFKAKNIDVVWSTLSTDSRFKLLTSPTLRVKDGANARFVAGQDVPTLGALSYQGDSSIQSVEYRPSGVILDITPRVYQSRIDLDINQQVSNFTQTFTGVNSSPTLLKRELKTSVSVENGEVIVLGGLDESSDDVSNTGFSFLPSFLRGHRKSSNKTEIILMLFVETI
jgi:type II secretory pathway component GspD/PulD (secretin)